MTRMDAPSRLEARGLARARIRARRARVRTIRRRTIRGSLALFAVLWVLVFVQLVSGNDPALSHAPRARRSPAAAHGPEPAAEPELGEEAEASLPEGEFAPEPEPEEGRLAEEEPPEPEPEPLVTSAS